MYSSSRWRQMLLLTGTALCSNGTLPLYAAEATPQTAQAASSDTSNGSGAETILPQVSTEGRHASSLDPVQGFVAPASTTGSKTDTPLIETPQAVSVVTRDEIDARQTQTIGEALRYVAGTRTESYGPDVRYDWFYLRGFEADEDGVFLNGLRYQFGNLTGMVEPYGLERIEVLRGPASVLYGQINPGGIVNLVSRHPTEEPQGEVRLSAGSYGDLQAAFTSSGRLTEDGRWSYSLTGLARDSGTQVDYVKNDRTFLAPAITFRPTADTRITLLTFYQHDLSQGDQFLPYYGTVKPSAYGRIATNLYTGTPNGDHYNRLQYGMGYEIEHRFDDVFTVRQNLRYTHAKIDWQQYYGIGVSADGRTLTDFPYQSLSNLDGFQVDTQGETRFSTGPLQHTLLTGIDYSHSDYIQSVNYGTTYPTLDLYSPNYNFAPVTFAQATATRLLTDQVGLYAQDQVRFNHFVLTVGLRQDWVDSSARNRLTGVGTGQDNGKLTWRAGLVYVADNGLAPYFSYATSFQPQTTTGFYGQTYKPTTGEQYEIGLKYQPPGHNSFVQAAAFHLTQNNVLTTDPNNALNQVQTGQIRVRGVELEGVANLSRGLNVRAQYTFLDPIITQSNVAGEKGNRPLGVPETSAGAYADYQFDPDLGRLGGLGGGAGVRFIGNTPAGNNHVGVVPSVTLVDASLRYNFAALNLGRQFDRTALQVNVSNLFDKKYVATCGGLTSCFYGLRRTVLGSLIYRW